MRSEAQGTSVVLIRFHSSGHTHVRAHTRIHALFIHALKPTQGAYVHTNAQQRAVVVEAQIALLQEFNRI